MFVKASMTSILMPLAVAASLTTASEPDNAAR
jgi:hypothetical protein